MINLLNFLKLTSGYQRTNALIVIIISIGCALSDALILLLIGPFLSAAQGKSLETPHSTFFTALNFNTFSTLELAICIVGTIAVSGAGRAYLTIIQSILCQDVGFTISSNIYEGMLSRKFVSENRKSTSELVSAICIKTNQLVYNVLLQFINILSSAVIAVFIFSALIVVEPFISIAVLAYVTLYYVIVLTYIRKRLKSASSDNSSYQSKTVSLVRESFDNIREVHVDNLVEIFIDKFHKYERKLRDAQKYVQIFSTSPRYVFEAVTLIFVILAVYLYSSYSPNPSNIITVLAVLGVASQRILPLTQQIYSGYVSIKGSMGVVDDVNEILKISKLQPKITADDESRIDFKSLELEGVNFSIHGKSIISVDHFIVRKADRVLISGRSGEGKTTFFDLVLGLVEPSHGTIKLNGFQIEDNSWQTWRNSVAYVAQSYSLFSGSLLFNITYESDMDYVDQSKLEYALKASQCIEILTNLEHGLNTLLGEGGLKLSGGQSQRVVIARALYKGASIILMDEPSSALDMFNEASLVEDLKNLPEDITLLIISHRAKLAEVCNRKIEISGGKIKEIV